MRHDGANGYSTPPFEMSLPFVMFFLASGLVPRSYSFHPHGMMLPIIICGFIMIHPLLISKKKW